METAFPSPDSVPYRANLMAFDPQKNVARAWRVEVERDLFGHVVVSTEWGRIGSRGQHKRISFSDDYPTFVRCFGAEGLSRGA
jgi:predicted DNA-binding WGR domain protein